MYVIC